MVDSEIARVRMELIEGLGRAVARMRAAENGDEWQTAVLESGRAFADDPAVLELLGTLAALTAPSAAASIGADAAARRFAKVKIAEIQLYHPDGVKTGRAARDLYGSLRPQIDAARDAFKERFLANGEAIPDYLHAELVRALANDDATLLGPGYPGALDKRDCFGAPQAAPWWRRRRRAIPLADLKSASAAIDAKHYPAAIAALQPLQKRLPKLADYVAWLMATARFESQDYAAVPKALEPVWAQTPASPLGAKAVLMASRAYLQSGDRRAAGGYSAQEIRHAAAAAGRPGAGGGV